MLNNRLAAARNVAGELFALEAAIDDSLVRAAAVVAALPAAKTLAGLSTVVGQEAYTQAAETLSRLMAAREEVVRLHGSLATIQQEIGLGTRASGDGWKIFPSNLSAVDNQAA